MPAVSGENVGAAAPADTDVMLYTHPMYASFDAGNDLPVVTAEGTRVTEEEATKLKAAAKANGLTLTQRKAG